MEKKSRQPTTNKGQRTDFPISEFLKKAIRILFYVFLYLLVSVAFPLVPTVAMMCYKYIVTYEVKAIEFAPDIAIAVVGVVASSLWGNLWLNKSSVSPEVKYFVLIIRFGVIVAGYSLYSFVYGYDPLKLYSMDLNASIPSAIFITCGIILFLNTIWELFFQIKARYGRNNKIRKEDSANE